MKETLIVFSFENRDGQAMQFKTQSRDEAKRYAVVNRLRIVVTQLEVVSSSKWLDFTNAA